MVWSTIFTIWAKSEHVIEPHSLVEYLTTEWIFPERDSDSWGCSYWVWSNSSIWRKRARDTHTVHLFLSSHQFPMQIVFFFEKFQVNCWLGLLVQLSLLLIDLTVRKNMNVIRRNIRMFCPVQQSRFSNLCHGQNGTSISGINFRLREFSIYVPRERNKTERQKRLNFESNSPKCISNGG